MKFWDAVKSTIKSPTGDGYDPIRLLFGIGGTNGVVAPVIFQAWAMIKGQSWDALAFCTAYGGMLAAVITAGGIAMKNKDKGMAEASAIAATSDRKDTAANGQ